MVFRRRALVVQGVQRDDLKVQMWWPASVDGRVPEPAEHVAARDLLPRREVLQGGVVEVAAQGMEAGAFAGDVPDDDGGAVVEPLGIVGDGHDGAREGCRNRCAGRCEEIKAEMDGAGLRAVVARDDERGVVVEQSDLAVATHAHRRPGPGDLPLDPGIGGTRTGEVVRVREVQAVHREVDVAGPGEHLGGHRRRVGPGLLHPRSNRFPGWIGHQTTRLAYSEFGQPPVGARQGAEELPGRFLTHGEVFVLGLLAHPARLDAHGKAEPQSRHGDDRPAFRIGEGRDRSIPPGDPARGFHRIRQPHHRIGGCDRELCRPPASHHVAEVDQPPQAVAVERWSHHHVVVVGVVVNDGHGKRSAHWVQPADGAVEGCGDQVGSAVRSLHGVQAVQMRTDRLGRGLHPPLEIAVELRVVEVGQGRVHLGQKSAEGLQHRHRMGAHLRQRDPVNVGECAGDVWACHPDRRPRWEAGTVR